MSCQHADNRKSLFRSALIGIDEVGRIHLDLSHVDRTGFRNRGVSFKNQEDYIRVDYEIKLTFDGMQLAYELIIPTNGEWWNCHPDSPYSDEHWGPQPYRETNVIRNNAAAFDVSGYQVCKSRPLPTSVAATGRNKEGQRKATARRTGKSGLPAHMARKVVKPKDAVSASTEQLRDGKGSRIRKRACVKCRSDRKTCKGEAAERPCWRCWRSGHECVESDQF